MKAGTRIVAPMTLILLLASTSSSQQISGEPQDSSYSCQGSTAWTLQGNPRTDPNGYWNIAYPETNATYWGSHLAAPSGISMIIQGQFPNARYMALQVYDSEQNVKDSINDQQITADPGQNNPFRTGTDQGTYTVRLVFGIKPADPPPNTIYTGGLTKVLLLYRVYYPDNPDDLTGGTYDPQLPVISVAGHALASCPPRPIITPEDTTVWGRLDNSDFMGMAPAVPLAAMGRPVWNVSSVDRNTEFYPNEDSSYMVSIVSREFLRPPYTNDLVILHFRPPTYPDTQAGEPPYLANTTRQVRFWSVCQNDPVTSGVMRCIADNQAATLNGMVTIIISDPSKKPSDDVLAKFGASWIAWGALQPGDQMFDVNHRLKNIRDGVFFQGAIIYRQVLANPSFDQAIDKITNLPRTAWPSVMGEYFPEIGYCPLSSFEALGAACAQQQKR